MEKCEDIWFPQGVSQDSGGDHKMVLVVRSDLKMGKGKIAAQVNFGFHTTETEMYLSFCNAGVCECSS